MPAQPQGWIQSSNELVRWSAFWYVLLLMLAVFDKEKREKANGYMLWVVIDSTLGIVATAVMSIFTRVQQYNLQEANTRWLWWCLLGLPMILHVLWWLYAPLTSTSKGDSAFDYALKHPFESDIPFLWLVDGVFVIGQPFYQLWNWVKHESKALTEIQKSEELLKWSFFWLFVLFGMVIFNKELHGNTNYALWLTVDWTFMLCCTMGIKGYVKSVVRERANEPQPIAACTPQVLKIATGVAIVCHVAWWFAAPLWPTHQGVSAATYFFQNPLESNIPILWLFDISFIILQPAIQWKLMQKFVRGADARSLQTPLFLNAECA